MTMHHNAPILGTCIKYHSNVLTLNLLNKPNELFNSTIRQKQLQIHNHLLPVVSYHSRQHISKLKAAYFVQPDLHLH